MSIYIYTGEISIFVCKNTYEKAQKILTFARLLVFEISLKYLAKIFP